MSLVDRRTWEVPADLEQVGTMVLEAADWLERHGVDGQPLCHAQLVLEELVANVAEHAYRCDGHSVVHVALTLDPIGISVDIEDDAPPFDPVGDAPEVDTGAPLEQRTVGGLGLLLVRRLADEFRYERRGSRNHVRLRIRRQAAGCPEPATIGDR